MALLSNIPPRRESGVRGRGARTGSRPRGSRVADRHPKTAWPRLFWLSFTLVAVAQIRRSSSVQGVEEEEEKEEEEDVRCTDIGQREKKRKG